MTIQHKKLFQRIKFGTSSNIHMQGNKQLSLQTGSSAVISIPPGAEIWIDGTDTGVKSSAIISDITSSPIEHILRLVLDGHEDYIDNTFTVPDGSIDSEYILPIPIPLSTQTGNLNITSILSNTEFGAVTTSTGVETNIYGTAPHTFSGISAGTYGYEAYVTGPPEYASMGSFEILPGLTTNLNISLGPTDPTVAMTLIESIPSGADIYIDGHSVNAKTSFLRGFTAESHTYELRKSGYQTKTGSFTPVIDIPNIVSEILQPATQQAGSDSGPIIMAAGVVALGLMMTSKTK
jgi:hypothetical protein